MKTNRHLISKFLAGELDPIQVAGFEKALLQDPFLKRETGLYQEVDKSIADSEVLDLRLQLNELHEPVLQELGLGSGKPNKRVIRYAVTAASIAILLGFGIMSILPDSGNIMRKFYSPYEMSMVTRSSNMNIDEVLREALIQYDKKQYREAVLLFEKVLDNDPEMISVQLYTGISYMEIKEYNQAEMSLNKVIEHNDNLFIEQAEWYIGFCYLMTDRKEKAIRQFTKIASENGYFSKKARSILKKIK